MSTEAAQENTTAAATGTVKTSIQEFTDGDFKGFKYTTPEYTTEQAIATLGTDVVAALINAQLLARIRTKVKNDLPKNLKPDQLPGILAQLKTRYADGVLFSAQEALEWRPNVRDLTPNQLFKKAKELFEQANSEPDTAKKTALINEAQSYLAKMAEAMQG
jgi:hypothetical protein